ncbi:ABC transporter substrate-binding protein [Porphyromonas sp.]|uniref:ABC transporter substrate-binding protein n=1 Tax=Porphyromonas sp. TaxID=1924944 RepID=UPI0026DCCE71|nr:ABC transporter substrate-binding protein [Porphyromonas sp.]MDO4771313.1 ABC transporter substrate-binding protein [Porphyromonas sp.]
MKKFLTLLIFITLTLASCIGGKGRHTELSEATARDSIDSAFGVEVTYAKGFEVNNHVGYKEVVLFRPDSRDTLALYIMHERGKHPAGEHSPRARFISVPIRTLGCLSTTEIGAIAALDLRDILVAAGDLRNISDQSLRAKADRGEITEISRGMGRNVEQIIASHPEVLLQSIVDTTDKDEDIIASGIEIVLFNNWKETDLLGRAEWLKIIGILCCQNAKSDSLFRHIEKEYIEAKALVPHDEDYIAVMYGHDYKGAWYVPGEYSYVTSMLEDARVRFEYIPGQVSGEPKSFEHIFTRHHKAKIWLNMMATDISTVKDFVGINERYAHFDAVKDGEVWVDRKRVNEQGGNDIWESGVYNPHLLLKDIIKITRPHLLPDYDTSYWLQLRR